MGDACEMKAWAIWGNERKLFIDTRDHLGMPHLTRDLQAGMISGMGLSSVTVQITCSRASCEKCCCARHRH